MSDLKVRPLVVTHLRCCRHNIEPGAAKGLHRRLNGYRVRHLGEEEDEDARDGPRALQKTGSFFAASTLM